MTVSAIYEGKIMLNVTLKGFNINDRECNSRKGKR